MKNEIKKANNSLNSCNITSNWRICTALDRSGQSIAAFLQPGNYFEAGISVLDPNVSGKVRNGYSPNTAPPSVIGLENTSVGEMAGDYYFLARH